MYLAIRVFREKLDQDLQDFIRNNFKQEFKYIEYWWQTSFIIKNLEQLEQLLTFIDDNYSKYETGYCVNTSYNSYNVFYIEIDRQLGQGW